MLNYSVVSKQCSCTVNWETFLFIVAEILALIGFPCSFQLIYKRLATQTDPNIHTRTRTRAHSTHKPIQALREYTSSLVLVRNSASHFGENYQGNWVATIQQMKWIIKIYSLDINLQILLRSFRTHTHTHTQSTNQYCSSSSLSASNISRVLCQLEWAMLLGLMQDQHLAQFTDIDIHWHRHFTKSIVFNNSGKYYHKTIASTIN